MTRFLTYVLATGLAAQVVTAGTQAPAPARDWAQWRGPARDGRVTADLPKQWPATLSKRWEVPVGSGHSSPVIAGNRVIVLARQADQEVVRALDVSTGRQIWRAEYTAQYTVNPAATAHGPGPKSTPAVAGGRVFTFSIGGVLSAFDLAGGKLLWRTPPPQAQPEYGTATSPLVDGNVVIAHMGGYNSGAITAFDVLKGTPRWKWDGDGPGYGSPIIATIGGVRQLITQTQKHMVALDAAKGTLLWQLPLTTSYNQNSVTPIVSGDLVVFSGLDKGIIAVRVRRNGSQWTPDPAWKNDQQSLFMSSPFVSGTTLFGLSHRNRGQLFALDLTTGKALWTTKGRDGENASLMGNRTWLLASTTNGELLVAENSAREFKELRRYKIADSALWAHPAITTGAIVVKDVDKVICWAF
jgi:outer membrane protein assembly factor BamB